MPYSVSKKAVVENPVDSYPPALRAPPFRQGGRLVPSVYRYITVDAGCKTAPLPIKAWSADH